MEPQGGPADQPTSAELRELMSLSAGAPAALPDAGRRHRTAQRQPVKVWHSERALLYSRTGDAPR